MTLAYNSALVAFTTAITVVILQACFGPVAAIAHGPFGPHFVIALSVMALVQYIGNSVLAAVAWAWKTDQPVAQVYRQYCIYTSVTYFAGASAAGFIAKLIGTIGFYALIAVAPMIAIIYLTYRTYLKNIEVSATAAKTEA